MRKGGTFHRGKSVEKYMRSLIIDDILSGVGNVSTEYFPGSFRAIGSKSVQSKGCYSFERIMTFVGDFSTEVAIMVFKLKSDATAINRRR